jgi:multicomponent Na+:H+ antiporter subunit B
MKALVLLAAAVLVLAPLTLSLPAGTATAPIVSALAQQSGVPNLVSGVILHTRLYDTIAEVVVFSLASLGVGWLLRGEPPQQQVRGLEDPVSVALCQLGATMAALVAVELALRGHLSPGGGFASGVAGGTAVGLLVLSGSAQATEAFDARWSIARWEKGAVLGFLVLAFLSLAGIDLPLGAFGSVASGGWIVPLNILMALKVTMGSWAIVQKFVRSQGLL